MQNPIAPPTILFHHCEKDMVCLEERIFKCYKCLDQQKEYTRITNLHNIIKPICQEIANRSLCNEKITKYKTYQLQQDFTEDQYKQIMDEYLNPQKDSDDTKELQILIKQHSVEIQTLNDKIKVLERLVDLIRIPAFLDASARNLPIEFSRNDWTVDMVQQYEDYVIELWMFEMAIRSKRFDVLDRLLNKYFKGIEAHILPQYTCKHAGCQIIILPTEYVSQTNQYIIHYLHIVYGLGERLKMNKIPIEYISHDQPDDQVLKDILVHSLFNYYFKLNMRIISNNSNHSRDLSITRFAEDGIMITCGNKYPMSCRNGKLLCTSGKWRGF